MKNPLYSLVLYERMWRYIERKIPVERLRKLDEDEAKAMLDYRYRRWYRREHTWSYREWLADNGLAMNMQTKHEDAAWNRGVAEVAKLRLNALLEWWRNEPTTGN